MGTLELAVLSWQGSRACLIASPRVHQCQVNASRVRALAVRFHNCACAMCAAPAQPERPHLVTRVIAQYNALCGTLLRKYHGTAQYRALEATLYDFGTAAIHGDEWRFVSELSDHAGAQDRQRGYAFERANEPAKYTPAPALAPALALPPANKDANLVKALAAHVRDARDDAGAELARVMVVRALRLCYGTRISLAFTPSVRRVRRGQEDAELSTAVQDLSQLELDHGSEPVFDAWPALDTLFATGSVGPALVNALASGGGAPLRRLLGDMLVYNRATGRLMRVKSEALRAVSQLIDVLRFVHGMRGHADDGAERPAGVVIAKALALAAAAPSSHASDDANQRIVLLSALSDYMQNADAPLQRQTNAGTTSLFARHLAIIEHAAEAYDVYHFGAVAGSSVAMLAPVFGDAAKQLYAAYPSTPLRYVCAPGAVPLYMYKRLHACYAAAEQMRDAITKAIVAQAGTYSNVDSFSKAMRDELEKRTGIDNAGVFNDMIKNASVAVQSNAPYTWSELFSGILSYFKKKSIMAEASILYGMSKQQFAKIAMAVSAVLSMDVNLDNIMRNAPVVIPIALSLLLLGYGYQSMHFGPFRAIRQMPLGFFVTLEAVGDEARVPYDRATRRVLEMYAEMSDGNVDDSMMHVLAHLEESLVHVVSDPRTGELAETAGAWFSRRFAVQEALVRAGYGMHIGEVPDSAAAWAPYEHAQLALRLVATRYVDAFMRVSDAVMHPTRMRVGSDARVNAEYAAAMRYRAIVDTLHARARSLHVLSAGRLGDTVGAVYSALLASYTDLQGANADGEPLRKFIYAGATTSAAAATDLEQLASGSERGTVDELASHADTVAELRAKARQHIDNMAQMELVRAELRAGEDTRYSVAYINSALEHAHAQAARRAGERAVPPISIDADELRSLRDKLAGMQAYTSAFREFYQSMLEAHPNARVRAREHEQALEEIEAAYVHAVELDAYARAQDYATDLVRAYTRLFTSAVLQPIADEDVRTVFLALIARDAHTAYMSAPFVRSHARLSQDHANSVREWNRAIGSQSLVNRFKLQVTAKRTRSGSNSDGDNDADLAYAPDAVSRGRLRKRTRFGARARVRIQPASAACSA